MRRRCGEAIARIPERTLGEIIKNKLSEVTKDWGNGSIGMHKHELSVLLSLKEARKLSFGELLERSGLSADEARWALSNLSEAKLVETESVKADSASLTDEGKRYAKEGLPEELLAERIARKPVALRELSGKEEQIGIIWAKKKGLAVIDNGLLTATQEGLKTRAFGTAAGRLLAELARDADAFGRAKGGEAAKELLERGLIEASGKEETRSISITQKGMLELAKERQAESYIDSLDRNAIRGRLWAGKKFRPYNVEAGIEAEVPASRHVLRNLINEMKQAYTSMGFREISGPVIEPAFWVFDHLFVPQDHPARDAQDTFFLSAPESIKLEDRDLVKAVKEEHERAWHSQWSQEAAEKAVLRTHTTSVTGRYIRDAVEAFREGRLSLGQPIKVFTIGRVFRNENLDYKHLADFYQADGIVIGRGMTLSNLFSVLARIYSSLGVRVKFKPSYFPFVEPGVEVQIKHGGDWLELGGAGIIRREITGVDRKSISVLAWGLGVERIALIRHEGIRSIVSLYNNSAGALRESGA